MTTSIELSNCSIWQQVSLHLIEHRLCPLPIRIMHARSSEFMTGLLQERHDGMKVILAQKAHASACKSVKRARSTGVLLSSTASEAVMAASL